MTTRFDTDTDIRQTEPGRFEARIDTGWWVVAGPNGGYIAAILLRALEAAVDDPTPGSALAHDPLHGASR